MRDLKEGDFEEFSEEVRRWADGLQMKIIELTENQLIVELD